MRSHLLATAIIASLGLAAMPYAHAAKAAKGPARKPAKTNAKANAKAKAEPKAKTAKPKAKAAADGWIEQPDISAILHLLGVPEQDWVTE